MGWVKESGLMVESEGPEHCSGDEGAPAAPQLCDEKRRGLWRKSWAPGPCASGSVLQLPTRLEFAPQRGGSTERSRRYLSIVLSGRRLCPLLTLPAAMVLLETYYFSLGPQPLPLLWAAGLSSVTPFYAPFDHESPIASPGPSNS